MSSRDDELFNLCRLVSRENEAVPCRFKFVRLLWFTMNRMQGDLKVLATSLILVLIIDVSVMMIVVLMPTPVGGDHAVWRDIVASGRWYRKMYILKFICNRSDIQVLGKWYIFVYYILVLKGILRAFSWDIGQDGNVKYTWKAFVHMLTSIP